MPQNLFESLLSRLEERFETLSRALVSGDTASIAQTSAVLRQDAVEFGHFLQTHRSLDISEATRLRMAGIASGLAAQREGLLRRAAVVDQSLSSLVPGTRRATYAPGSGPFGSNTRQSGAFRLLSA